MATYNRTVVPPLQLDDAFVHEALRINERYLREIVDAFSFCPWARGILDTPALQRSVFLDAKDTQTLREHLAAELENIAADTTIEIALFIFPRLECSAREFRSMVGALESQHSQSHALGQSPLAMASFHPQARADLSSPAKLVPFIRRSPDPTIQLVRRSVIAKVRGSEDVGSVFAESLESFLPLLGKKPKPALSDSIAQANLRTVEKFGVEHIEKILEDIIQDRSHSYLHLLAQFGDTSS